jgi:hypothetical protein
VRAIGERKERTLLTSHLAGSVVDFSVVSYAIVGSIIYSLRLRKVPGLTAEGMLLNTLLLN